MTCYFRLIHVNHESELCGDVTINAQVSNDLSLSSAFGRSNVVGKGGQSYCSNTQRWNGFWRRDVGTHVYVKSVGNLLGGTDL